MTGPPMNYGGQGSPGGSASSDFGGGGAQPGGANAMAPWMKRKPLPARDPNDPRSAPQTGAPPPQTFAQMSAAGQARPAPPPPQSLFDQAGGAGLGGAGSSAPPPGMTFELPPDSHPILPVGGGTGGTTGGTSGGDAFGTGGAPPSQPPGGNGGTGGGVTTGYPGSGLSEQHAADPSTMQGSLSSSILRALNNPSRYASGAFDSSLNSGMATLQRSFGAQQKQIDEEMARRGVGASSIASGYYGDLAGQQANAQASLLSGLLTNQANNEATDRAQAQGAGQASVNSGNQQDQFFKNLSQQMGIAGMTDKTANRGISVDQSKAQNDWLTKLIGILSSYGGSTLGQTVQDAGGVTPKPPTAEPPGTSPKSGLKGVATAPPTGTMAFTGDSSLPPQGINGMGGDLPSGIAAALGGGVGSAPPTGGTAFTGDTALAPPQNPAYNQFADTVRQAAGMGASAPPPPAATGTTAPPGDLSAGISAALNGSSAPPPASNTPPPYDQGNAYYQQLIAGGIDPARAKVLAGQYGGGTVGGGGVPGYSYKLPNGQWSTVNGNGQSIAGALPAGQPIYFPDGSVHGYTDGRGGVTQLGSQSGGG